MHALRLSKWAFLTRRIHVFVISPPLPSSEQGRCTIGNVSPGMLGTLGTLEVVLRISEFVEGGVFMEGNMSLGGNAFMEGDTLMEGNVPMEGDVFMERDTSMEGNASMEGDAFMEWDTLMEGNTSMEGDTFVEGDTVGNEADRGKDRGADDVATKASAKETC
ncbi:hypothetical protein BC826DRAFT_967852 [Russula brevipes]|nr:hypothetical protein BC826DRAFT_967852 [Russula brevipes]